MKKRVLWRSCVIVAVGCLSSGVALAQSTYDCSGVADDKARLKCYDEEAARAKRAKAPAAAAAPATTAAPAANASPATTALPAASAAPPATSAPSVAAGSPPATAASSAKASQPAAQSGAASSAATSATSATAARQAAPASDFGLDAEVIRKRQAAADPSAPKEAEKIVATVKAVETRARGEYRITLDDGQVWDETQHSSNTEAPRVGETVTIKRGMLGSYFLSHSAGLALRVKRIN
jgi:hypothetical protein